MGSGQVALSQTFTVGEIDMNGITEELFGTTKDGSKVKRYTLVNSNGSILKVIELGATATELHVRDREGNLADVVLDPIRKAFRAGGLRFSATGGPAYGWQVSGFRLPALPMSRY